MNTVLALEVFQRVAEASEQSIEAVFRLEYDVSSQGIAAFLGFFDVALTSHYGAYRTADEANFGGISCDGLEK